MHYSDANSARFAVGNVLNDEFNLCLFLVIHFRYAKQVADLWRMKIKFSAKPCNMEVWFVGWMFLNW